LKNDFSLPIKTYGQGSERQVRSLFSGTPSEIWPGGVLQSRCAASAETGSVTTADDLEKRQEGGKAREIQIAKVEKALTSRNFYGLAHVTWGQRHSIVFPPSVIARCGKSAVRQS